MLWGANPANNQPVFMKYLYLARRAGLPGGGGQPLPRAGARPLLGAVQRRVGAVRHEDVRPARAGAARAATSPSPTPSLKRLIERGAVDEAFVAAHTEGWDELVAALAGQDARRPARGGRRRPPRRSTPSSTSCAGPAAAIHVWSMGITQHRDAVDGVRAIVNLALARGNVGRDGAGLMPIRGHSGVQGGAEMGAYATALPGGLPVDARRAPPRWPRRWGFAVPDRPGLTAPEMVEAAGRGDLDVLWMSGGNFLDVLPDPPRVRGRARAGAAAGPPGRGA